MDDTPAVMLLYTGYVAYAAWMDAAKRRIPNGWILTGFLLSAARLVASGLNGTLLWQQAAGLGLAFLLLFPVFAVRALGAGDVKLAMVLGAFTGPADLLWILLISFGLALIWSLLLTAVRCFGKNRARHGVLGRKIRLGGFFFAGWAVMLIRCISLYGMDG